ncbi:hypothetical protein C4J91_4290 [Pseudomonas sp. R3-52-08]|nr:hypothetical protein C4J91_4290 [Pseudomonas sp. R3-52-08]
MAPFYLRCRSCKPRVWTRHSANCGRGLAPDDAGSANTFVTDTPLSGCRTVDIVYI